MSIKKLKEDLSQLEKDALKAGRDSQALIKDLGKQVEAVEDDVLAAEFLTATSAIENLSTMLESAIRLGQISKCQVECFFEDNRRTLSQLKSAHTNSDYANAVSDHIERRVEHVSYALEDAQQVVTDELSNVCEVALSSWELFAKLLVPEWSLKEKR